MAVLQIGRVGVDADIDRISGFRESSTWTSDEGHQIEITGFIRSTSLANTNAIRTELLATVDYGAVIPVTWTQDPTIDGWYYLRAANVDGAAETRSLDGAGFYGFNLTLARLGGKDEVNFQSKFTGNVLTNKKETAGTPISDATAAPYWCLPLSFIHVDGVTSVSLDQRESEDGNIRVWRDMTRSDAPTWAIAPTDYYDGAARIKTSGVTRAGYHTGADAITDWELSNGLVKLTSTGSNLDLDLGVYDGATWDPDKTFLLREGGSNHWTRSKFSILRNDPEACAVRLYGYRGAATRWLAIDLQLRRGSHFVTAFASCGSSGGVWHLYLNEAGTLESTHEIVIESNTTTNGHDYFVGMATEDGGGQRTTSTTKVQGTGHSVVLGAEVNRPASDADSVANMTLQYLGWITERVTPLRA